MLITFFQGVDGKKNTFSFCINIKWLCRYTYLLLCSNFENTMFCYVMFLFPMNFLQENDLAITKLKEENLLLASGKNMKHKERLWDRDVFTFYCITYF